MPAEALERKFGALVRRIECEQRGLRLVHKDVDRRHWTRELKSVPKEKRLAWACAWEKQERGAWHLHVLMAAPNLPRVRYRAVTAWWKDSLFHRGAIVEENDRGINWLVTRDSEKRGGRSYAATGFVPPGSLRVDLVASQKAVRMYVAKYVAKEGHVVCSWMD
tara:strand:- start:1928 stop:2416 length:489 start_codon:yes stop_codon:yes gene_type:complete